MSTKSTTPAESQEPTASSASTRAEGKQPESFVQPNSPDGKTSPIQLKALIADPKKTADALARLMDVMRSWQIDLGAMSTTPLIKRASENSPGWIIVGFQIPDNLKIGTKLSEKKEDGALVMVFTVNDEPIAPID